MKAKVGVITLVAAMVAVGTQAEIFGTGANQFAIDFVGIGNAGNVADVSYPGAPKGFGAVDYDYRIGMLEVTIDQFTKAYNADSRIGNGNENHWNDGTRTAGTGAPASFTSWHEGAKFANWLTTGDAYTGAYQFNGSGVLTSVMTRAQIQAAGGTFYVLPTEDEWYKAAYYKPVDDGTYSLYASGLDTAPTHGTASGWNYYNDGFVVGDPDYMWESGFGGEEQNGTYDMMGNAQEWTESAWDGTLDNMDEYRPIRGGNALAGEFFLASTYRYYGDPTLEGRYYGFRVAAIPEPSGIAMVGVASGLGLFIRRRLVL